jgi:hypothetical protein
LPFPSHPVAVDPWFTVFVYCYGPTAFDYFFIQYSRTRIR